MSVNQKAICRPAPYLAATAGTERGRLHRRKAIPAENSKTSRTHVVPLSAWALDEFKRLKKSAGRSIWVLPAADRAQHLEPKLLTRGLAKCAKRFKERGVGAFTLHDLPRTCRTGLAKLGIEPHIAERVIGHAQDDEQACICGRVY